MSIHTVFVTPELRVLLSSIDCWNIRTTDIGKLAALVIGNSHMPQLRHGTMSAIIVGQMYGAAAKRLVDEFCVLAQQCAAVRTEGNDDELCAIAFFHLRFGGIHPLVDSNGRVARLLLAEQMRRAFAIEPEASLEFLQKSHAEYRAAFMPTVPQKRFELMTALFARATGGRDYSLQLLPFPIGPAYPDKRPLLDSMKHSGSARKSDTEKHAFQRRIVNVELQRALDRTQ